MRSLAELVAEERCDTLGLEQCSATVLYTGFGGGGYVGSSFGGAGYAPLFRVIDLPGSHGQLHIHGWDANRLTGGRLYDYSRDVYKPLNAYEVSMFDMFASNLGLKKKDF